MTYGPVAALLAAMVPPAVCYFSLSIPYHAGTGYFGGFLPFIASYMVTRTDNSYAGLAYTLAAVGLALLFLLGGPGRDWRVVDEQADGQGKRSASDCIGSPPDCHWSA